MAFAKNLIKSSAWLSLGQIINLISSFIWVSIISRYIGPEQYGIYGYAFSISSILILLVNFGLDQHLLIQVSANKRLSLSFLKNIIKYKVFLTPIFIISIILLILSKDTEQYHKIILLVSSSILIEAFSASFTSTFYAHQLMQYEVNAQIIKSLLSILFAFLGVSYRLDFIVILALNNLAFLVKLFILYLLFNIIIKKKFMIEFNNIKLNYFETLKESLPLFLLSIVGVIYSNLVVLIVEWKGVQLKDLGNFVAAVRLQNFLLIIPSVLYTALTPALAEIYSLNKNEFIDKFLSVLKMLYLLSFLLTFIVYSFSEQIVLIVYGNKFLDAVPLFSIQSLILLGGPGYLFGSTLLIIGKKYINLLFYLLALIIVSILSILLIPRYGVVAASWATVSGVILGQIIYPIYIFKYLKIHYPVKFVLKLALTILMLIITNFYFDNLNLPFLLKILSNSILIPALLVIFKLHKEKEIVYLKSILFEKYKLVFNSKRI